MAGFDNAPRFLRVATILQPGRRPQFTDEMKAVLNSAKEIIVVGASFEEIPPGVAFPEGCAKEERRAALAPQSLP